MESTPAPAARPASSLKSVLTLLLGVVLGVALTFGGLWYQAHSAASMKMAGVWTGTAQVAGTEVALSLTLQNKGQDFSGLLEASPGGAASFDALKVDPAGNISFTIQVASETVSFTGKVGADAHTMTGNMTTTSYGNGTWSLNKQS
jgi:hypothetical protein